MSQDFKYINGFGTRYKLFPDGRIISSATGKEVVTKTVGNNKSIILFNGNKYVCFTIYKLIQSHFGIELDQPYKIESLEGEEWAPIPGYEKNYMISTHGRIKAINVTYHGERLLKPTTHRRGSLSVSLTLENHKVSFVVCNLMGRVFLPNPHNYKMVIHLDVIKKTTTSPTSSGFPRCHAISSHGLTVTLLPRDCITNAIEIIKLLTSIIKTAKLTINH